LTVGLVAGHLLLMASILGSRRLSRRTLFAAPLLLAAASACAQGDDIKFERSSLVIVTGGRDITFDVEMAVSEPQHERGLMFRKQMGAYEGMLFDFVRERPVTFWMKNTLIPLDMVFIAADGTVRHVHANATPMSTDTIPSESAVRGVLEINGGTARLLGIKPGDKVRHAIFGS
jgi:uncharacterized membrane protein (UPF0127 family)